MTDFRHFSRKRVPLARTPEHIHFWYGIESKYYSVGNGITFRSLPRTGRPTLVEIQLYGTLA